MKTYTKVVIASCIAVILMLVIAVVYSGPAHGQEATYDSHGNSAVAVYFDGNGRAVVTTCDTVYHDTHCETNTMSEDSYRDLEMRKARERENEDLTTALSIRTCLPLGEDVYHIDGQWFSPDECTDYAQKQYKTLKACFASYADMDKATPACKALLKKAEILAN